jgi:predicted TIM-barrel fold metal-dependent hydrolase
MPDHLIIDGDTHILEMDEKWDEFLEPKYRELIGRHVVVDGREVLLRDGVNAIPTSNAGEGLGDGNGSAPGGFLADKQIRWRDTPKAGWDAKARLELMDKDGIDLGVFFPTMGNSFGPHNFDAEPARAISRAYNRLLANFLDGDRRRLHGCALVPQAHPQVAADELRYAVTELGLCGVLWPPQVVNGRGLADPRNDPIFAAAQELDVPVVIHISIYGKTAVAGYEFGIGDDFRSWVALGHVSQTQAALAEMLRADLPRRFPNLRIGLFEGGVGWLPYMMERYDEYWKKVAAWQRDMPIKPSQWFKEHRIVISGEAEELLYPDLDEYIDHLIFAGDYPHFDYDARGLEEVLESTRWDATGKRKIFQDNPAWFFGLKVGAPA